MHHILKANNPLLDLSLIHILSPKNSSWKDMRPILATESREVSASADTHMVMNTVATVTGTPIFSRNPATPEEKMEKMCIRDSYDIIADGMYFLFPHI